jgi:hypothetical protein
MSHQPATTFASSTTNTPGCGNCGSVPAKHTQLQSFTGLVIIFAVSSYRGMLCRNCAVAMGREMNARTLRVGWWTIFGFMIVGMGLLANGLRLLGFRRLPWPTTSSAHPNSPLTIGAPLRQRPSVWVLGLLGGLAWAAALAYALPILFM